MIFAITTLDGTVRSQLVADNASHALELLARSQGYNSFMALCADLNFDRGNFTVAELRTESTEPVDTITDLNRQRDSLVSSAFRFARRTG